MLVHIPALLAKALIPSLYPLKLALFDPLTQVCSQMAELHMPVGPNSSSSCTFLLQTTLFLSSQ